MKTLTELTTPIKPGFPILFDASSIANSIGVSLKTITWLMSAYKDEADGNKIKRLKNSLYKIFEIPKPGTNKKRTICAPDPRLKHVQKKLAENLFNSIPLPDFVMGFRKGIGIRDMAEKHAHKDVIVCIDLENFFPTITQKMLFHLFNSTFEYNVEVSKILSELVTFHNYLPQGACTSPVLSNLYFGYTLDTPLRDMSKKEGYTYTRYADDLVFSADTSEVAQRPNGAGILRDKVIELCATKGFNTSTQKTKIMRKHRRQWVLGQVVNEMPNIKQKEYKKLKAIIFNSVHNGIVEECRKTKRTPKAFISWVRGNLAFLKQIRPDKAENLIHLFKIAILEYKGQIEKKTEQEFKEMEKILKEGGINVSPEWQL